MLWSFKKFKEEFNQVPIHALLFHIVQEGFQPGIKDEKMSTEILLTNMFSVHTLYLLQLLLNNCQH